MNSRYFLEKLYWIVKCKELVFKKYYHALKQRIMLIEIRKKTNKDVTEIFYSLSRDRNKEYLSVFIEKSHPQKRLPSYEVVFQKSYLIKYDLTANQFLRIFSNFYNFLKTTLY